MNKTEHSFTDVLHTLYVSSTILQQTAGQSSGELFILASTLRKSYNCGKANDMVLLTKLLEAKLLVCSFGGEVKYSLNELNTATETNGLLQLKPDAD